MRSIRVSYVRFKYHTFESGIIRSNQYVESGTIHSHQARHNQSIQTCKGITAYSTRNVFTGFIDAAWNILYPTTVADTLNNTTTEEMRVTIDAGR